MKFIAAFSVLLIVSSVQAGDKDIIKDRSPDRKFALRLTKGDEGWGAAIIDLKSNDDVVGLEIYLDGDGKMEIVVGSRYYEGEATTIYRCDAKKCEQLLSVGCGV